MSYNGTVADVKASIKSIREDSYDTQGTSPVLNGGGGGKRESNMSAGNNHKTKQKGGKSPFAKTGKY